MHVLKAAAAAIAGLCAGAVTASAQIAPVPFQSILSSNKVNEIIAAVNAAQAGSVGGQPLTPYLAAGQTVAGLTSAAFDAAPAINAALAAGVSLQLPCGVYSIGAPLAVVARDGARLAGTEGCTVFNVAFAAGDVIHLTGHFQTVRDIAFNATVSHTSGAAVHQDKTSSNVMDRLTFYGLWSTDAMLMDGSNTTFINDFNCSNGPLFQVSSFRAGSACIHVIGAALEVHIKHGLAARFDNGIRITHGSGVYVEGVDAVQNGVGIRFDPSVALAQSVFGVLMTNVLGDTSYADNWLLAGDGPITDVQLSNLWASSSSFSSGFSVTNAAVDGLHISNGLFLGNAGDGLNIVAGKNIVVTGSGAEFNNISNGTAGSGFHLHGGVSRVTISGSRAGIGGSYTNTAGVVNHQIAGIQVDAGAGDYLVFTGNNVVGNINAGMTIAATGTQVKTSANAGFTEVNSGSTTLPTGQASMTINTGIDAPDARINFLMAPLTSYAACGITGLSSSPVAAKVVTITATNATTAPCAFWWRASSWGN